jgi:Uncharacterized conserved protein involved in intracellular sulfur reduction
MKILIVINDAPYGTEKAYNALRLANQLTKNSPESGVRIFLLADGVGCAASNQVTPQGYYNIERMIKLALNHRAQVKICGSCAGARGLQSTQLIEGIELSTMEEMANWVLDSDKVLNF